MAGSDSNEVSKSAANVSDAQLSYTLALSTHITDRQCRVATEVLKVAKLCRAHAAGFLLIDLSAAESSVFPKGRRGFVEVNGTATRRRGSDCCSETILARELRPPGAPASEIWGTPGLTTAQYRV